MDKKLRHSIIPILGILAAFGISFALLSARDQNKSIPSKNEFGLVPEIACSVDSPKEIPVTDCTGDTDMVRVLSYSLDSPRYIYNHYSKEPAEDTPPSILDNGYFGMNLRLRLTAAEAHVPLSVTTEKRESDGSWSFIEEHTYTTLPNDEFFFLIYFPIHEPGTYRFTYTSAVNPSRTMSHTITIPEETDRRFDFVSLDRFTTHVAVMLRANYGELPYQDLQATKLEKKVSGSWVDVSSVRRPDGSDTVKILVDMSQSNPYISPTAYSVEHPFTHKPVDNVFCGTADVYLDDEDAEYRLTLIFCEKENGSGERWALTIPLR